MMEDANADAHDDDDDDGDGDDDDDGHDHDHDHDHDHADHGSCYYYCFLCYFFVYGVIKCDILLKKAP